jgi:amino acid adenylation domain-containing protein
MHLGREEELLYLQSSGMDYLTEADGLAALGKIAASDHKQVIVLTGDQKRIHGLLYPGEKKYATPFPGENSFPDLETDIKKMAAAVLKINPQVLDIRENLGNYGFDSINLKEFARLLQDFYKIEVTPSIFFQYSTLHSLGGYLQENYKERLDDIYRKVSSDKLPHPGQPVLLPVQIAGAARDRTGQQGIMRIMGDIAIVGAAGIFPGSRGLENFWQNLQAGKDMITEVPRERWDWRDYYSEAVAGTGKTNSRWGGFIPGVDRFDASFFNISSREAETMDPQQRLLLEILWKTIEDAGYKCSDLSGRRVGVFIGAAFNDYERLLAGSSGLSVPMTTGNHLAILANRLSFFFNLRGPSEVINTACSSSLAAVHRAVKSLQEGESEIAAAGGVSLMLSPHRMIGASQLGLLSPGGQCKTFDKDADGYVMGEGAGIVLLKPLSTALYQQDHIYAVIKGSAVNHGGRAYSLTAPNTEALAALIMDLYEQVDIDPGTITYIETHGAATELGDSVEINALKQAFKKLMEKTGTPTGTTPFCGLGSVKGNIGNLEPASGIAGLIKVILAMKHKKIPAALHCRELNPLLNLQDTPFYIAGRTTNWESPRGSTCCQRRAGVTSFGFGGTAVHVLLEEYQQTGSSISSTAPQPGPQLVLLSARDKESLKIYAGNFIRFLGSPEALPLSLTDIAYTLQVGREPMKERLAAVISHKQELKEKLRQFCHGDREIKNFYLGNEEKGKTLSRFLKGDEDCENFIRQILRKGKLDKAAQLWVSGLEIDWNLLYPTRAPSRVSLPLYPFAGKRYWIPGISRGRGVMLNRRKEQDIHPFIGQKITSPLLGESVIFQALFTAQSPHFLTEHVIHGFKLSPAAAHISMTFSAAVNLWDTYFCSYEDIEFINPLIVEENRARIVQLVIGKRSEKRTPFKIVGKPKNGGDSDWTMHCKGFIVEGKEGSPPRQISLEEMKNQLPEEVDGEFFYQLFKRNGFHYGESFRGIQKVWRSGTASLAFIRLKTGIPDYRLYDVYPALLDIIFQSVGTTGKSGSVDRPVTFLPLSLGKLRCFKPLPNTLRAYCKTDMDIGIINSHITVFDETGDLLMEVEDFLVKETDGDALQRMLLMQDRDVVSRQTSPPKQEPAGDPGISVVQELKEAPPEKRHMIMCKRLLETCVTLMDNEDNKEIDINKSLMEQGMDSLVTLDLRNRLSELFNISIPIIRLFKHPTVARLADYIIENLFSLNTREEIEGSRLLPVEPVEKREYFPLSSGQMRMYILQQRQKSMLSYNLAYAKILEGQLEVPRFEEAFKKLIKRHESLRTSFEWLSVGNGSRESAPVQRIYKHVDFKIDYSENRENKIDEIIKNFIRPFDLGHPPLLRVQLVHLSGGSTDRHLFLIDMHHIISDATSVKLVMNEISDLYQYRQPPALTSQYMDFTLWQMKMAGTGVLKQQENYWLECLSGELPVLNLPLDYPRPSIQQFEGEELWFTLEKTWGERLDQLTRETDATLYMILLAVYKVLLFKYTGQEDILVGATTANRPYEQMKNVIGMFMNTVVLRNFPYADKTFRTFLAEVKECCLGAYENQDYQFEALVNRVNVEKNMGRNALFDTMLVLLNIDFKEINIPGLNVRHYPFKRTTTKLDIYIEAIEFQEQLHIGWEYCTKLFKRETIRRMASHYKEILQEILDSPGKTLGQIEMLSGSEHKQLLFDFNDTQHDYPGKKTIWHLFLEEAASRPDKAVLTCGDRTITYKECREKAARLGYFLRNQGVRVGSFAALMVDRSLEMIIGTLGILNAGAAYLPVDPELPGDRIIYTLADSMAGHLIMKAPLSNRLEGYSGKILDIDHCMASTAGQPGQLQVPAPGSTDTCHNIAYVIYTSGSTGKPKGIIIEHRSVINFIRGMAGVIDFSPHKTMLAVTTISFDIFLLETLLPLVKGMRVVIANNREKRTPKLLGEIIKRNGIDMLQSTPSGMWALVQAEEYSSCLEGLKEILLGGELLPANLFAQLKKVTGASIYNLYGPTETTVWSTLRPLTTMEINIGTPIFNTRVYILSPQLQLQPIGVAGELLIGGHGVGRGYLNRPQLTWEKFINYGLKNRKLKESGTNHYNKKRLQGNQGGDFIEKTARDRRRQKIYKTGDLARWLPDGNIEFLGRIDYQVKIRGYRVELKEIETVIIKTGNVNEVVVTAPVERRGTKGLCAYLAGDRKIDIPHLREKLKRKLPHYMVPLFFIQLKKLPRTPNGKIDRKALPKPAKIKEIQGKLPGHGNEVEETMVKTWKEILELESIGSDDNFFEMGGHSLRATELILRVNRSFNLNIEGTDLFNHQTFKELVEFIQEKLKG